MQDISTTSDTPLTQIPPGEPALTSEQILVQQWPSAVGLEDVFALECLLDEALGHLGALLKRLPEQGKHTERARKFLAQFQ